MVDVAVTVLAEERQRSASSTCAEDPRSAHLASTTTAVLDALAEREDLPPRLARRLRQVAAAWRARRLDECLQALEELREDCVVANRHRVRVQRSVQ